MTESKLESLLHQYFNNTISEADCIVLLAYLEKADQEKIDHLIDKHMGQLYEGPKFVGERSAEVFNRIITDSRFTGKEKIVIVEPVSKISFYQQRWLQIAAVLFILATAAFYFLQKNNQHNIHQNAIVKAKPIVPGSNKALLTLGNGKIIMLDGSKNGVLDRSDGSVIEKTEAGKVTYTNVSNRQGKAVEDYITLATPKGGEYQLTLPDGTRVWLNAASSLRFPAAFSGSERRVVLNGEAYFEVAKDNRKPFYVDANKTQVRVLGTHFNISAYQDDDHTTTTLLEGAVQVTKNKSKSKLSPGQQAVIKAGTNDIAVSAANGLDAIAWKNGYFIFNDDDINGIMKKVSRWYDVEVICQEGIDNQKFGGTFYRHKSITELVHYLEKIGNNHFKIEGRRIIVMK